MAVGDEVVKDVARLLCSGYGEQKCFRVAVMAIRITPHRQTNIFEGGPTTRYSCGDKNHIESNRRLGTVLWEQVLGDEVVRRIVKDGSG